ncbi:hypothetical protein [Cronobacter sp. JZ38]|uniref:hypothetical protein n=1 Tax=Cronobacter sp. JZ38 TaxID=1906275 RepID=UPI002104F6D3|nr:hypothetical protein [Cronobacter sp. JZ38]
MPLRYAKSARLSLTLFLRIHVAHRFFSPVSGARRITPVAPPFLLIQRLIATGFSVAEIRAFPVCMLLIEGASFCPETQAVQYQRLKAIEEQIIELEQRKARLLAALRQNNDTGALK